jgi:hypothetical protein
MDPNETLRRLRACADEDDPFNAAELLPVMQEHFRALDEWLSKGGFVPDAWNAYHQARRPVVEPLGPPDPAHGELPGELCTRCLGVLGEDTVTDDQHRGYHAHCWQRWGAVRQTDEEAAALIVEHGFPHEDGGHGGP